MDNNKNGGSGLMGTVAVLVIALLIWKILPGLFKLASMLIVAAIVIFAIVVVIMVIYAIKSPVKQQRGGVETDANGSAANGRPASGSGSAQGGGAAAGRGSASGNGSAYAGGTTKGGRPAQGSTATPDSGSFQKSGTAQSGGIPHGGKTFEGGTGDAADTDIDGNGAAGKDARSNGAAASNLPEELKKAKTCLLDIMNENVKIRDTEVRGLSSQVASSADKIINTLADQPEDIRKCRQFYNYYLPTYLKILKKYRKLELSGLEIGDVRTELLTYMKRIGSALDKQYEMLFENDKFDLSVEMEALDQSLKRSGLLTDADAANVETQDPEAVNAEPQDTEMANVEPSDAGMFNVEQLDAAGKTVEMGELPEKSSIELPKATEPTEAPLKNM